MDGICTLANDHVYEQLIALLNSIEAVLGCDFPVCIYPYDDRTSRIEAELAHRPNVQLFQDTTVMQRWDEWVRQVWDEHPTAHQRWSQVSSDPYYRVGTHRRFCAFEGPFDRFLYMDADTLLLGEVQPIFAQLDHHDWVVYDFQHTDLSHVYDVASSQLTQLFTPQRLTTEIFCSGFYAAKKGTFNQEQRQWLLEQLQAGEADILYCMAPDQTILNYMVMRSQLSVYNFGLQLPESLRTGCCVTSDHFLEQDHCLFDRGNRLTYLHYIGLSSSLFRQICTGENITFPYRDLFLHYRYLNEPENRPLFTTRPKAYNQPPCLAQRVLKKLKLA